MLDYPGAPSPGDTFTDGAAVWRWDGAKWLAVGSNVSVTAGVSSWNGRTGSVSMTLGDVTGVGGAPLASPVFTGNPQSVTPAPGDNDTSIATTAFVANAISGSVAGVTSWNGRTGVVAMTLADVTNVGGAPIASPALTGTPTTTTAVTTDSSTRIASTAYVQSQISAAWRPVVQASTIKSGINLAGNVGPQTDSSSPWATFTGGDSFAMGSSFYNFYVVNYNRNAGTGHRQAFNGIMNVHGSTDNGFNVGVAGFAYADGGGPNQIVGMNSYAQTSGTATSTAVVSFEANTDLRVSGSPLKIGVQVVDVATSTQDGATTSAGIVVAKQSGGLGYQTALQFGLDSGSNAQPTPSGGTLIRTAQTWTCARGIDFRNTTFSVAALDMLPGQAGAGAYDGNTIAWAGGAGGKLTNRTATNGPRIEFQNNVLQFHNNGRTAELFELQFDVNAIAAFGLMYPNITNAIDLGTTTNRWRTLYTNNNPSVSSDPALKSNIERLPPTLGLVCSLNPIRWQWHGEDRTNWGFSAPEVKAAFDGIGQDFAGVDEHSLRYGDLIAVLWKAVSELAAQVAELQGKT